MTAVLLSVPNLKECDGESLGRMRCVLRLFSKILYWIANSHLLQPLRSDRKCSTRSRTGGSLQVTAKIHMCIFYKIHMLYHVVLYCFFPPGWLWLLAQLIVEAVIDRRTALDAERWWPALWGPDSLHSVLYWPWGFHIWCQSRACSMSDRKGCSWGQRARECIPSTL